ncbi:MAG: 6-phosphofructokinase [Clostridia bacterium]|nr:6-phosphofructokinase [Clostridia bacterium]
MDYQRKTIGILTSGGDCPGLNAAIRGVAKPAVELYGMKVIGFSNGYKGFMDGEAIELTSSDLSGILTLGGTILGTSREPFKEIQKNKDKIEKMVNNYKKFGLDCLVVLGGNGTHKTANLLRENGLNVIGLPKTIDNDLFGTDFTFGFHSAVDIATDVIDRIHSTAQSHGRAMIIELMGHKTGWLSLYAGIAGGADIILIPELPYSIDRVIDKLNERHAHGKKFSIIVVAEGAMTKEEVKMSKKEFTEHRMKMPYSSIGFRIAAEIEDKTSFEARVTVPGYQQRGGTPSAYDRVLATKFGIYALELILKNEYGLGVGISNNEVSAKPLEKIAGKLKTVPKDHMLIKSGLALGTCFGQD